MPSFRSCSYLSFLGYKHTRERLPKFRPCKNYNSLIRSRNYRLNRNGNSASFFSFVCNSKKIKELFASGLNGITASVRCVSSIIVVLNAKLTRLITAHANKKDSDNRKSLTRVPIFAS